MILCSPSSYNSLPEYLLYFFLSPGKRSSDRQSHHRTLIRSGNTWAQGTHRRRQHRNLTGRQQQFGLRGSGRSTDSPDCCPYSWSRLPSWTPRRTTSLASTLMGSSPSEHLPTCARRVRGYGLLLGFPRHPLTSDDDALVFLGPCLQGLHHVFR